MVNDYRSARAAGEDLRDEAVGVYGYDSEEWASFEPRPITFKEWLVNMRGSGE